MSKQVNIAMVGCGNIAGTYAKHLKRYPHVNVRGYYDIIGERTRKFAAEYGGTGYNTMDEVLADPEVDLVVNLTTHHAHEEVIRRSLLAGKHVYTEKPMALSSRGAHALADLAAARGLRLASAPITYMGDAQQTAWKVIREGRLGTVRVIYAEVNHGRIETWHPNPEPFYDVGVLWDVAVYPLTLITTFFGPVRSVLSFGRVVYPDRVTLEGRPFHLATPDFTVTALELAGGPVARLTANFYVPGGKGAGSLEMHGDAGSLFLGDFQNFSAKVEYARYGEAYAAVPCLREPFQGAEYSRGVEEELAAAMLEDRPQRATGTHAAHIVDILDAISQSMQDGRAVEVTSTFTPPAPMDWAGS